MIMALVVEGQTFLKAEILKKMVYGFFFKLMPCLKVVGENSNKEQKQLQYPIAGRSDIPHTRHNIYNIHNNFTTAIHNTTERNKRTYELSITCKRVIDHITYT
jgi:hypothetical protein